MHIQTNQRSKIFGWGKLFLPEDTSSQFAQPSDGKRDGALGGIKCCLWIVISIAVALSIGQL